MTVNKRWIVMLGALCCLIVPVAASAWTVGERGEADRVFLHDQQLEGVYGNNWWGKSVSSGASGQIDVYIDGEGKTADFDGILSLNCDNASGYVWKTASNFGAPVNVNEIVPLDVVVNARNVFCPR